MIERAHQMYREGKYEEALVFYTDALCLAKTKPQKIALHSNRAACFLKLHRFNKVWFYFLDFKYFDFLGVFLCGIVGYFWIDRWVCDEVVVLIV